MFLNVDVNKSHSDFRFSKSSDTDGLAGERPLCRNRPDSSAAAPPRPPLLRKRVQASQLGVFWRAAQAASVAGWPRPSSRTKAALLESERGEDAAVQTHTFYTRAPENKKRPVRR